MKTTGEPAPIGADSELRHKQTVKGEDITRSYGSKTAVGRLYVLDIGGGIISTVNPDGPDRKNIRTECGTPATRGDIEVFYDELPEPIDLELDLESRVMYWTDRGDPPRGNTVNRASVDEKPNEPDIVFDHLEEAIGIALDIPGDRMFMTDMAGSVYTAKLEGSEERPLAGVLANITGIAFSYIPPL